MRPTPSLARDATLAALFAALALALRRPELSALAAPFVVSLVGAALVRPKSSSQVVLELPETTVYEGDPARLRVRLDAPSDIQAISFRLDLAGLVTRAVGTGRWTVVPIAGSASSFEIDLAAVKWGRHKIELRDGIMFGPGLSKWSELRSPDPANLVVLPSSEQFRSSMAPPFLNAYAGEHRSRTSGPGVDFASVRPFTPGDPVRRVNWRASLRSDALQVSSSFTDHSSALVVILDTTRDAGARGRSSLDVSVRAAASLVEHYLRLGDAVRLVEFGGSRRSISLQGGSRRIEEARRWLASVEAPRTEIDPIIDPASLAPRGSRSTVIVVSPLLAAGSLSALAALRQRGAAVVAVDTLRDELLPTARDDVEQAALSMWWLEREMLAARLVEIGVPVVRWSGVGTLDSVFADMTRVVHAPRMSLR